MGIRRSNHCDINLPRKAKIIRKLSLALKKTHIFLAENRLAN
jgi:hypothetical protein